MHPQEMVVCRKTKEGIIEPVGFKMAETGPQVEALVAQFERQRAEMFTPAEIAAAAALQAQMLSGKKSGRV